MDNTQNVLRLRRWATAALRGFKDGDSHSAYKFLEILGFDISNTHQDGPYTISYGGHVFRAHLSDAELIRFAAEQRDAIHFTAADIKFLFDCAEGKLNK